GFASGTVIRFQPSSGSVHHLPRRPGEVTDLQCDEEGTVVTALRYSNEGYSLHLHSLRDGTSRDWPPARPSSSDHDLHLLPIGGSPEAPSVGMHYGEVVVYLVGPDHSLERLWLTDDVLTVLIRTRRGTSLLRSFVLVHPQQISYC